MGDGLQFLLYLALIGGLVGLSEALHQKGILTQEANRKLVHVGVGLFVSLALFTLHHGWVLAALAGLFVVVNAVGLVSGALRGMHTVDRETWGTVLYPLAVVINTLLLFDHSRTLLLATLAPMFFGDALASLVGRRWPLRRFASLRKSLAGALVMYLVSIVFFWALTPAGPVAALLLALIPTLLELSFTGGLDNLAVPLGNLVFLSLVPAKVPLTSFAIALLVAGVVAYLALRARALTPDGALVTLVLGTLILAAGGVQWLVPILVFFITSSALTKIFRAKATVKPGESRDGFQVLANGGLAALFVTLQAFGVGGIDWFVPYLAALAVVNSDTWSTEIGSTSRSDPRSILFFKKVPKGSSGAVSWIGSLGGVLGSLAVALTALFFGYAWNTVLLAWGAGMIGNLVDSLLGATVEVRYRCETCGGVFDVKIHCNRPTLYVGGLRWFGNNWVNFVASSVGALGVALWLAFR